MKLIKSLLLGRAAIFAALRVHTESGPAPRLIRARTRDTANGLTSFSYRMPAGIPGDVNRAFVATVEADLTDEGSPPLAYGIPVKLNGADGIGPITGGETAVDLYGVLVRPYPTNVQTTSGFFGSNPLGTADVPPDNGVCNVLKRGYITVKLYGATAAVAGGAVYVRIANAGAGEVVGGFEAAADGGDTIQAGAKNTTYFRGPADASGNVEIAWNV